MSSEVPFQITEQLRQFDIHLGVPLAFPEEGGPRTIAVPNSPHVFLCKDLFLIQPASAMEQTRSSFGFTQVGVSSLPVVQLQYEKGLVHAIHLEYVMVMICHAHASNHFVDAWRNHHAGRSISSIVAAYQDIASASGWWPRLDIVIACRPSMQPDIVQTGDVTFERTYDMPVIRPKSPATIKNEGILQSELISGVGATLFASADAWEDISYWFNYWSSYLRFKDVPLWAVERVR